MTDTSIPDVGDLAICCNCLEEKKVYERVKVKGMMEWYCEECTPQKMRFDHM